MTGKRAIRGQNLRAARTRNHSVTTKWCLCHCAGTCNHKPQTTAKPRFPHFVDLRNHKPRQNHGYTLPCPQGFAPPGGHEANEASRARMAIETCEKHAVEGVGRVAERASIRDDNRRIVYSQGRKIAWSKKWPKATRSEVTE